MRRVFYKFGNGLGHTKQMLEHSLLQVEEWGRRDATADEQAKVLASIRQSIREHTGLHKLCFVAAIHRSSVLLVVANKTPDPDFTEEEWKALAAVLKQQKKEGSR
jgi:hypothetical protein